MKRCFFFICTLLFGFLFNATAKQITVTTSGLTFSPSSLNANIGDTIHFVYGGGSVPHTTTSTSVPAGAATWNAPLDATHTSFNYVIKIGGDYAYQCNFHVLMGMVGSFKVPPLTKISVLKTLSVNSCISADSIQYKGSVITVNDTMPFTIKNLQLGSYFITARGNNGTDALTGKSATSALAPVPTGVLAKNIKSTTTTIKWNHLTCVKFYTVQFRKKGVTTWTKKNTVGNKDSLNLTGLTASTIFEFQVASNDSVNKKIATSKFSALNTFTTTASLITVINSSSPPIGSTIKEDVQNKDLLVYPNPATNSFTIQTNGLHYNSAKLFNADGIVVWSAPHNALSGDNKLNVNVSNFASGTYFLVLIDVNNKQHLEKIVVEK